VRRFLFPKRTRRAPATALSGEELARRVRRVSIAARRRTSAAAAGAYRSAFHGRGMEFSEVREYRPGDDVRAIDWNVTARAGVPYVKLFREERDRTLLLAVDLSASLDYGSGASTKRELAAEAAAALALAAVRNRDRVGAVIFSDRIEAIRRPARGERHAMAIVRELLSLPLAGFGTDLARGIEAAGRLLRSRAMVVLISDFRAADFEIPLGRLRRRHEVIAIAVRDPAERRFPSRGLYRAVDAETGAVRVVDADAEGFRASWPAPDDYRAACLRAGADVLELSTRRAPAQDIARFFERRMRG
jgi:uncharacterized protein (DUF58 family)